MPRQSIYRYLVEQDLTRLRRLGFEVVHVDDLDALKDGAREPLYMFGRAPIDAGQATPEMLDAAERYLATVDRDTSDRDMAAALFRVMVEARTIEESSLSPRPTMFRPEGPGFAESAAGQDGKRYDVTTLGGGEREKVGELTLDGKTREATLGKEGDPPAKPAIQTPV